MVCVNVQAEQRHADVDLARSLYHESLAVNSRRAQTLLGLGMLEAREGNTTEVRLSMKGTPEEVWCFVRQSPSLACLAWIALLLNFP